MNAPSATASNPVAAAGRDLDPLRDLIRPPRGLLPRWNHYSRRYGALHAALSFLGRHSFRFWCAVGPIATRAYLQRWLAAPGPRVLNLGGGIVVFDRWLTADMEPRADVFMDVTKPLPLPDAVLDVIYSEEVIEHIPRERGVAMLAECSRTLKPGGWIRITTPSLDYFARRVAECPDGAREINDIFYQHYHRCIYSEQEMRGMLEAAGFVDLYASSYRDPKSRFGEFDTHATRVGFAPPEWSQYWEARKPASAPRA